MSYLEPAEFVTKMVDSGESKIYMGRRDTVIRAYMAGAILALAVVFAVTITVQTGNALLGAVLFPVGFCMLYLMKFDLLTGVFMLTPLAWRDGRPAATRLMAMRRAVSRVLGFELRFGGDGRPAAARLAGRPARLPGRCSRLMDFWCKGDAACRD